MPRSTPILGLLGTKLDIGQFDDNLETILAKLLSQIDIIPRIDLRNLEFTWLGLDNRTPRFPLLQPLVESVIIGSLARLKIRLRLRLWMLGVFDLAIWDPNPAFAALSKRSVPERDGSRNDLLDGFVKRAVLHGMHVVDV